MSKKSTKKPACQKTPAIIGAIIAAAISSTIVAFAVNHAHNSRTEKESTAQREFTIEGTYIVSEIRLNIDTTYHPTINARGNLLTIGFTDLSAPITAETPFLVRFTDAESGSVVEFHGNDMTRYAFNANVAYLLESIEYYRRRHIGQSMIFDHFGNIKVRNADDEIIHQGGYLWAEHRLAVLILDSEEPRRFRNHLFFPNNEEFMQGTNCRRIIVREAPQTRSHGSLEVMFGARCPESAQPLPGEPDHLCFDDICPDGN